MQVLWANQLPSNTFSIYYIEAVPMVSGPLFVKPLSKNTCTGKYTPGHTRNLPALCSFYLLNNVNSQSNYLNRLSC